MATRRSLPKLDVHLGNVHRKNVFESRGRAIKQEEDFPSVRKRTFLGRPSVTWSRRREELFITQMEQMWTQNKKEKWCRVELRQWMCRISDIKKKRLQQKTLEYVLARSWREECSRHSGSHGHSGSSCEASAWTDRSHTRCLDSWAMEATLWSRVRLNARSSC